MSSVIVSFLGSLAGSSVIWSSLSSLVIKSLLGSFSGSLLWSSVIVSSLGSSVMRSSLMSLVLGSSLGSSLLVFCYAILSERIIFGVFREKVLLNALGPWVVFSVLSPLFLLCYLLSVAPTTFCLNTSLATDFFYSFRRNVK